MSRLRVHNLVVSLDGYATGDDQSTAAPFGTAQSVFWPWFQKAHVWRPEYRPEPVAFEPGPDESIAATWHTGIGADIIGRNMYRPGPGPWSHEEWRGWWGEEPPFGTPCFVMTHWEHEPLQVGSTVFRFVEGTPAEVLRQAREAAGGLDVRLGGGPTTIIEFLAAGLVDYLHLIQIPVVVGRGIRLWDGLGGLHEQYDLESMTMPNGTTHFFFTRRD